MPGAIISIVNAGNLWAIRGAIFLLGAIIIGALIIQMMGRTDEVQ